MYIEFSKTNKKQQRIIEDALWFAKSYLLPKHKIDEIHVESVKRWDYKDGDCYDTDDRSYHIRVRKNMSEDVLIKTIFHEFAHIKQSIKKEYGDIFGILSDDESWISYDDRPYEMDAFKLENEMFDKYAKDGKFKFSIDENFSL